MWRRAWRIFLVTFVWLAIANGVVFLVLAVYLGGDALSGKVENGHYYLSNHGRLTEVSSAVWTYSKVHAISVMTTFPVGVLLSIALLDDPLLRSPAQMFMKTITSRQRRAASGAGKT